MPRTDDIVGYTYKADTYCNRNVCINNVLATGDGEKFDGWRLCGDYARTIPTEDNLNEVAAAFGINRNDERTFDSDEFPKVIFRDQLTTCSDPRCGNPVEVCGNCGEYLEDS